MRCVYVRHLAGGPLGGWKSFSLISVTYIAPGRYSAALISLRSSRWLERAREWVCFGFWAIFLQACSAYHPVPLDSTTVAAKLKPPSMDSVRIEAKAIRHPILKPIGFDLRDGLSPDEAAILAVIANPTLRASRDQRQLAAAQVLQAGILPNPQVSYGLDIPTGGMTADTVNAFNLGLSWDITSLVSGNAATAAAQADQAAVDVDVAWQEWQVAQDAKLRVYHLGLLERQLTVARLEETGLTENLDRVRRAVNLGAATRIELAAAEAALQKMHATVLITEQQRDEERLALNQALGFPAGQRFPIEEHVEPPSLKTLPPAAVLARVMVVQG